LSGAEISGYFKDDAVINGTTVTAGSDWATYTDYFYCDYTTTGEIGIMVAGTGGNVQVKDFSFVELTDPDDWDVVDVSNVLEIVTTPTRSGNTVKVTDTESANLGIKQSVALVSGSTYKFSAWVYHNSGGTVNFYIYRPSLVVPALLIVVPSGQWTKIEHITSATATNSQDLWMYINSASDGQVFYIDDISTKEIIDYKDVLSKSFRVSRRAKNIKLKLDQTASTDSLDLKRIEVEID